MLAERTIENKKTPDRRKAPVKQYTLAEYLRLEARSAHKHQFYNGKIARMPNAKGPHNEISANVITALNIAIWNSGKPYRVFSSDQKIYFPALNFGVYPDSVAVSEQPVFWDENQLLLINPLLIVEVLSKSTRNYDRNGKFDEYKTLPSFKEYLLIEQDKFSIESRFREAPDLWRENIVTDPAQKIFLKSIGLEIALADVYRNVNLPF